jgi:RNA polymerase sigma-70 factor (ECF subfamily)
VFAPTQTIHDLGFPSVLGAAGRGEQWALAELFRAYQPPLLRYLRAQEPGMADDLAGEVWVAVTGRLTRFEGDEAGFRSWLFTIGRRRLIDHRRRRARRRTDPVPHERLDGIVERGLGGDPSWLVLDRLSAQAAVDMLVADLSPDQAEVVLLRVVGGFDVPEVAQIMGRSPGSVRVLCHRALRRLAGRFGNGDGESNGGVGASAAVEDGVEEALVT